MRRTTVAGAVLVLAVVAALLLWRPWTDGAGGALMASGTVEATEAQLGFQASGRIEAIEPREGDTVRQGSVLARLDTRETEARLAQARAQQRAATVKLSEARRDRERSRALFKGGAIGREAFDKAQAAYDLAQSEVAQAEANMAAIEALLANMAVHASFDGIVTVRHREPGEIVGAGQPVLTVMNPADRWVRIYIPEFRVGAVKLGQRASIASDTFPEKSYAGEVVHVASQAEFTPKNVQTTEERVRLVYAVKVRVLGDPDLELKPGMPADVSLEVPPL